METYAEDYSLYSQNWSINATGNEPYINLDASSGQVSASTGPGGLVNSYGETLSGDGNGGFILTASPSAAYGGGIGGYQMNWFVQANIDVLIPGAAAGAIGSGAMGAGGAASGAAAGAFAPIPYVVGVLWHYAQNYDLGNQANLGAMAYGGYFGSYVPGN